VGDPRHQERDRVACVRPECLSIVPLGDASLHGTIASVEWYGAALSVSVVLDAVPDKPVLVTMQRSHGPMPEKGARISLRHEVDDVVLISE
jgi:2-aminoethylphosphonate transport system ATP-binding protein